MVLDKSSPLKIVDRVSYSSLVDLKNCGWYFKLAHVLKLPVFRDSLDTHFGKILHKYMQELLQNKSLQNEPPLEGWNIEFDKLYQENKDLITEKDNPEALKQVGRNVIQKLKEIFEKEFPYKEVVAVEQRLEEKIFPDKYTQFFKGFIDIVFKLDNDSYVIADIKTCSSTFMFKKYQDKHKEYQLTLYKHFYATKFNIDPEKIETYFILVEKNPTAKKPIQFSRVTSGKVKINNALEWVDGSLATINRSIYMKNRMNCHAFGRDCIFYNTEHCKK